MSGTAIDSGGGGGGKIGNKKFTKGSRGSLLYVVREAVAQAMADKDGDLAPLIVDAFNRLHVKDSQIPDIVNALGAIGLTNTLLQTLTGGVKVLNSITTKRSPIHYFDTGAGTDFKVFAPQAPFKIMEIRFHTAALAAGEDLTITRTTTIGEESTYYNVILFFEEIGDTGTTDLSIPFGPEEGFFRNTDTLVFALSANTGSDRWGLEVIYELV